MLLRDYMHLRCHELCERVRARERELTRCFLRVYLQVGCLGLALVPLGLMVREVLQQRKARRLQKSSAAVVNQNPVGAESNETDETETYEMEEKQES